MAKAHARQQLLRPSMQHRTLWTALLNPIAFLGWARKPKPKPKRRDMRTVISVLPRWYEHYSPAALQALPPRASGSDKKRVAFAKVTARTFNPKAPPCMVALLEETVVCIHQHGAGKAMDRLISSVGVFGVLSQCIPEPPILIVD